MKQYEPFLILLSSILRHFLSIAGAGLVAYGASEEQIGNAVEATIAITIGALVIVGPIVQSYFSKVAAFKSVPPTPIDGAPDNDDV